MLVRRMVDHKIHDQFHVTLLELLDQIVHVRKRTIAGIDVFVTKYVGTELARTHSTL